ncbi:EXS family protein [Diaporthe helianthi]|uniref:EXS family protein n=1 Tax=Diaporthe helianthi TaxID=158607 RepID=A0A2P5I371_DIAHE|nr:EXS family protein [Diaporthe helianthi]
MTHNDPQLTGYFNWLALINLLMLGSLLLAPPQNFAASCGGRDRLLETLRRISLGGLAQPHHGKFADTLLADAFISLEIIYADLVLYLALLFSQITESPDDPEYQAVRHIVKPIAMSIPVLIRFRQCLTEFGRAGSTQASEGVWGGWHLLNAGKYISSIPFIIFDILRREAEDTPAGIPGEIFYLWLVSHSVNTAYSFWWDISRDWDLKLLVRGSSEGHAFGLRKDLLLFGPAGYYLAIFTDLTLRCLWMLKISPSIDRVLDKSTWVFILTFLELVRRAMWALFRMEAEWVRVQHTEAQSAEGSVKVSKDEEAGLSEVQVMSPSYTVNSIMGEAAQANPVAPPAYKPQQDPISSRRASI